MLFSAAELMLSASHAAHMLSADYWTHILYGGYSRQFFLQVMQCYSGSCNGHITCWWYKAHVIHKTCNAHVICRTLNVRNCMSIHHTCYLKVIKPPVIFRSSSAHVISRSCNPFYVYLHPIPSHAMHMLFAGYSTHIRYYIIQVMSGTCYLHL